MPLQRGDGGKPLITFDPLLEVSPFALFRRLKQGRPVTLVDVRSRPSPRRLAGAAPLAPDWEPSEEADTVLVDEDGSEAVRLARELQARGFSRVRALFGGLELYEYSLDPEVIGEETFLETD